MNIFLDFDGTILHSMGRVYTLFSELIPESQLSYAEYWELKRTGIRQDDLLKSRFNFTDSRIADYKARWMRSIEDEERLATDYLFPGAEDFLNQCSRRGKVYLATNRQRSDGTIRQIERLGIRPLFDGVLVTEQVKSKADKIRASGIEVAGEDLFVGDTGEDIHAARMLGVRSVAVTWGFIGRERLCAYAPDEIVDDIREIG